MKPPIPSYAGCVLVIALLTTAPGCTTKDGVRVSRDAAVDFSHYRSWRWLPTSAEEEVHSSEMERELGEAVLMQIGDELARRGFSYQPKNAHLGIGARLAIRREVHVTHHSTAIETLPTFDNSPPYEIQATRSETTSCERGRLTIRAVDLRDNREVWQGEYEGPCRDSFAPHLREAVARTLERFPSARSKSAPALTLNPVPAEAGRIAPPG